MTWREKGAGLGPLWRLWALWLLLAAQGLVAAGTADAAGEPPDLRVGDIIFQRSQTGQSALLELVTQSPYTHMGVLDRRENGEWIVLEAWITVQHTPLAEFKARGRNKELLVMRLRDPRPLEDPQRLARFLELGEALLGRPYDFRFEWDDQAQYCSELVWKLYKQAFDLELTPLVPAKSMQLDHPLVQRAIGRRFGPEHPFNPEEPVVAPSHILDSPLLERVPGGREPQGN